MDIYKIKNLDERTIDCGTVILGLENCLKKTCWKCPYLNESKICNYAMLEDALFMLKYLTEKEIKKDS